MKILVSACLLGENCKYSGGNNFSETLDRILRGHTVVPVCPEVLGGLSIPRSPCEIADGIVMNRDGENVDRQFREGAAAALAIAEREEITLAILQPRSPSCGSGEIYDGSFSGRKIPGNGVFAQLLKDRGITVLREDEAERYFEQNGEMKK